MLFWRATVWRSQICQSSWLRRMAASSLAAVFIPHDTTGETTEREECLLLCCLTFELSGSQRQDARPGQQKMYTVPAARAWWPAVGAPLERGVRQCCAHGSKLGTDLSAGCPYAEYFHHFASNPEVKPVLCFAHQVPANFDRSPRHYLLAKAWVMDKDEEDALNVYANRTRRRRPVLSPPRCGSFDLATGASLDDVAKGHGYP